MTRQFVLGVVQPADGLPLMNTVHAGNMTEAKTLQPTLVSILQRCAVERVIDVADRGLPSLDGAAELQTLATTTARQLQFILAVPARRYRELGGTLATLTFDPSRASIAERKCAEQRLVVAHDPQRESSKRRGAAKRSPPWTRWPGHL